MRDVTAINALIGMALPLIIATINQWHWSKKLKGVVSLAVSLLAAAVVEFLRGDVTWTEWRDSVIVIAGSTLVFYQTLWKPSEIAPAIEKATTVAGPVASETP